jgi:TfoX/Sxy family transcriptional regulator of competence genes
MVQIRIKKTLSEGLLYVIICSKEINKPEDAEAIKMNEFNEYVREVFSAAGDIVIRSMMGGYLVYLNGKLIGDICDNELFLKRTPTSDRLLEDSELRYPYEESKTLMHVFDRFEDAALVLELLDGMYKELPEKKSAKAR